MMCLDPAGEDYADVRIGPDLLARADIDKADLREIETWLASFLADPTIVTADIKGLLNRTMGRYNQFDIGGRSLMEAVLRQTRTHV
jgi:hypothetical protein